MKEHYSGCEFVELGVQIEKNGVAFYNTLKELTDNEEASEVFQFLADAEKEHINVFQEILEQSCDLEPKEAYPEEYFAYMNALAGQYIFTKVDKGEELARSVKSYAEGLDLGIQFEKDSILFFEEARKFVPEKAKTLIDKLIIEEKKHLNILWDLKGGDTSGG